MNPALSVDMRLYNARVITLEGEPLEPGAVAVFKDRIAAVGSTQELAPLRETARRSMDLNGAVVAPGFIDAHNHMFLYLYLRTLLDCRTPLDAPMEDLLKKVASRAQDTPTGEWIRGWGFADYKVKGRRYPTRRELDEAAPHHPVVIIHASGHSAAANSAALQGFDISANTPDPPDGWIEREPGTAEPNGVLHETAAQMVSYAGMVLEFLGKDRDTQIRLIEQGGPDYWRCGITSVHDASCLPDILALYQEAELQGKLPVRMYPMSLLDYSRPLLESGVRTRFGSSRLRIGSIKVMGDGSLSGRTAAVSEPYLNMPGTGILYMDQERMNGVVKEVHEKDFQCAIHAIGDRAVDQVVTAYESVIKPGSGNPLRHRIEHAGILTDELMDRMAALDLVVGTQPRFLFEQGDGFLASCGPERIKRVYPFRSLIQRGIRVAGSSDCPVVSHDPLLGIRDAVLRRTEEGRVLAPDERLSPEQALRMFTVEAARASFEEDEKGSLKTGKLADLVVLSDDPLTVSSERIGDIQVCMTMLGGEVVYTAGKRTGHDSCPAPEKSFIF